MTTDDYRGDFDPNFTLEQLSRATLARLCREYMMMGMYHDRGLMMHVVVAAGQDATIAQADSEWMGSSPIYAARNKKNLGMSGDAVGTAFKAMQFDVGAPHQYLDFQFEVIDHDLGYFHLPYCGAHDYLRHMTANDETLVVNMCHHMEDRTFDATLGTTNPRMRAIPIHRPPKADEFTGDHCRWEVRNLPEDDDSIGARSAAPSLAVVAASRAAQFEFLLGDSGEDGGMTDYAGDLKQDLQLEDFAHNVLVRQAKEFCLDAHILMRAAYWSVDELISPEVLDDAAPQQRATIAPVLVARLRDALNIRGDDMAAIGKILQVDPVLVNDYVRYEFEVIDKTHGRITFDGSSEGIGDDVCRSPLSWLEDPDAPGFEHMAQAVNPRARVRSVADLMWEIEIQADAEPIKPHWGADMVGAFGTAEFDLTMRPVNVSIGERPARTITA
jgi:hypothetical protein